MALSKAAAELAGLDGTQEELAGRFGVARFTWQRWLNGTSLPFKKKRHEIEKAGGPKVSAWDEPAQEDMTEKGVDPVPDADDEEVEEDEAPPSSPEVAVMPGSEEATADTTRLLAARLYRLARDELAGLEGGTYAALPAAKRLALMQKLGDIVVQLGKLTGAALLDERRIVASPAWRRCMQKLGQVLDPFPEAAQAIAAAFREEHA